MIFDKDGQTAILFQENVSLQKFLENLKEGYDKIKNDNIIVNLTSFSRLTAEDLPLFLELSDMHREKGKSFVIVTEQVTFDDIPDELVVVPTLREANDLIEMDEIERDLDLE
ncbi:ribonuclease Z [Zeaxanthinibacter enoshimensis]|uniref:Uncharacterized protein n=1 Tax=Zeaxanthinibacter enoshimensis TaxID=392009 RepID=A0A4R6TJG3_9FLAO|nr:ribonuclease Z [Zeaxanthinibacter enoshimensis]TDQ31004.1 hypothetical protein CLV82_1702 [Zeaxanthinibacter enoshimensis]